MEHITLNERKYECKNEKGVRYINAEIDPEKPPNWLAAPDFIIELIKEDKWLEVLELAAIGQKIIEKDKTIYKKLLK